MSAGPNAQKRARMRAALIERDGPACFYCERAFGPDLPPTFDHVEPRCRRRSWKLQDLVLACQPCNAAKADHDPVAFLLCLGRT